MLKVDMESLQSLGFHHIGIACRDIDREARNWKMLGYEREGDQFVDPVQGIRGLFMSGNGPRIELLEPHDNSKTLEPFLKRGIVAYHNAYLTPDISSAIDALEDCGLRLITGPVPAVAFDGNLIAFLSMSNGFLIELIEA